MGNTLTAKQISKEFPRGKKSDLSFSAVETLDLELEPGTLTGITGRSGSGKSTLLNMLSGMLTPSSGQVLLGDTDLYAMDEESLARMRNKRIGLIPQGNTALRSLTVLENVLLPAVLYSKEDPPEKRALEMLDRMSIANLSDAKPEELSGGELRRMNVARALIMEPDVVLADEPTAGLDEENIRAVLQLLRSAANGGTAVLVVTHEKEAEEFADRMFTMDGGKLL